MAVLTACGLQDHRETVGGGPGASAEPSIAPKAPLPSGKPLGDDAHVPSPSGVDDLDATSVSRAWVEVAYGYDTKYDMSPHDAVLRTARWLTPDKRKAERAYRPASGAGENWNSWASHKAWTTVEVEFDDDGDAPSDTATEAYRAVFVDGEAHGRDGWTGTGPQATVYLKLVRSGKGEPWRVDDVRTVEAAAQPPTSPTASPSTASYTGAGGKPVSPASPVSPWHWCPSTCRPPFLLLTDPSEGTMTRLSREQKRELKRAGRAPAPAGLTPIDVRVSAEAGATVGGMPVPAAAGSPSRPPRSTTSTVSPSPPATRSWPRSTTSASATSYRSRSTSTAPAVSRASRSRSPSRGETSRHRPAPRQRPRPRPRRR
ncbi:hypothetical protein [Streptomyces neyagawaensis]|uniref:hypothetical protein n=1 Tax=Streptomyces neyagawaensis TaxID=42238 RepID=UPI003EBBA356